MLELRKDASSPSGYWRAGIKKTLEEWEKIFGEIHHMDEWFIDLSKVVEYPKDEIRDIINEVFDKEGLLSITYKEATRVVVRIALSRGVKVDFVKG